MSLSNLLTVAGAVVRSQVDDLMERDGSKKPDLPLGLSFSRLLSFDELPFLLQVEQGLQLTSPGTNRTVVAHGRIDLEVVTWHRFYLSDEKSMLQIGVDKGGKVLEDEVRLFQDHDEVFPDSPEAWGFWLDDADGYIGYPLFQSKEQRFDYFRMWRPGNERVKPMTFQERLTTAPPQSRSFPVYHTAMLYGRTLPPAPGRSESHSELLLVSAVQRQQESWVEIQIGMPLALHYLRIT